MESNNHRLLPIELQRLRKDRRLSQKDTAAAIGISKAMYSRIESGERFIQQGYIDSLAQFFNADVTELYSLQLVDKWNQDSISYSTEVIEKSIRLFQSIVITK